MCFLDLVRVAGLNVSHAGKAELSARVALYVKLSPASTSAKVLAGKVKLKAVSSVADWVTIGFATVGASLTGVTVILKVVALKLPPAPSETVKVKLSEVVSPPSWV